MAIVRVLPVLVACCWSVGGCTGGSTPDFIADASGAVDVAQPDADPGDAAADVATDVTADAGDGSADPGDGPVGPPPLYTPTAYPGRHTVSVDNTRVIVPSDGIPAEAQAGNSNNNLDVVRHQGRVWLAWRTAPDHFASDQTRIVVVSSDDEVTWRYEAEFQRQTDLREPRLLELNGRLFLYLAELGANALAFEPEGTLVSERLSDGTWTPLASTGPDGMILWRARILDGTPFLLGYTGGEHEYTFSGVPLDIHLLTTSDGVTLEPLDPARPIVLTGGGSETDVAFTPQGTLVAVSRIEAIDPEGIGSRVCTAPAGDVSAWSCTIDPRKYDSPLVFAHDGEVYLVGRRHLSESGAFDIVGPGGTMLERVVQSQLAYSNAPKRCAIWRWDPSVERIRFITDLPSKGDTCFASMLPSQTDPEVLILYNYTSPWEGDDEPEWNEGQRGPTWIVRHEVRFSPR